MARQVILLPLLLVCCATSALADPYLVRDIVTETTPVGSDATFHAAVGERVFFDAKTEAGAIELWWTDGTPKGTNRVAEICTQVFYSCIDAWYTDGEEDLLLVIDGRLWTSDGTESGTVLLSEEAFPVSLGLGRLFLPAGDHWIFEAASDDLGFALWRTDLTIQGTVPFFDFDPPARFSSSLRANLDAERVLFVAETLEGSSGVWVSDGTAEGTHLLVESGGGQVVASGGRAYFFAAPDERGPELWSTDGTPEGTRLTREIVPGPDPFSTAGRLLTAGGLGYFFRDRGEGVAELWRSDGTEAGTFVLRELTYGFPPDSNWRQVAERGDIVYFVVEDLTYGLEIWRSDGTVEGTRVVEDVCPGNCGITSRAPTLEAVGDDFLFWGHSRLYRLHQDKISLVLDLEIDTNRFGGGRIRDLGEGFVFEVFTQSLRATELWYGDDSGTVASIASLSHIGSMAHQHTAGRLIFSADGGDGIEPWVTDGIDTSLLRDVTPAMGLGSDPRFPTTLDDRIVFFAGPDRDADLWASDGTEEGTRRLASIRNPDLGTLTQKRVGDLLFFAVTSEDLVAFDDRHELWVSDATPRGTHRLATSTLYRAFDLDSAVIWNDELLVIIDGAIWSFDGTEDGTRQLTPDVFDVQSFPAMVLRHSALFFYTEDEFGFDKILQRLDLADGTTTQIAEGDLGAMIATEDAVYYVAPAVLVQGSPATIWRTDASGAEPTEIMSFSDVSVEGISFYGVMGTELFFPVFFQGDYNTESRTESWRSDGTAAGTFKLDDHRWHRFHPLANGFLYLLELGSHLEPTLELWWGDGAGGSHRQLGTWEDATAASAFKYMAVEEDKVFFSIRGIEAHLWVTDGTVDGTVDLARISPGPFHFQLGPSVSLPGYSGFRFFASRGQLWRTDGRPEGTTAVVDLDPLGSASWLTLTAERLFFSAYGGYFLGQELWALPVWELFADDPTALYLGDFGRFRVEVEWSDGNRSGLGQMVPLRSDDSGLLWFFSENNWEMLIKVLDGCAINQRFWVFAGATTTVGYSLRVTDTATGETRLYENPLGQAARPIADSDAFATCGATGKAYAVSASRNHPDSSPSITTAAASSTAKNTCPDGGGLCLGTAGRFRVTVNWDDGQSQGTGTAVSGSSDSGLFWFFSQDNWEMLVKVLDGCNLGGHHWVFASSTTTVAYELRVEDTQTGAVRFYRNPLGTAAPAITDTAAFRCNAGT